VQTIARDQDVMRNGGMRFEAAQDLTRTAADGRASFETRPVGAPQDEDKPLMA
jgi:hypothetical protein